MKKNVCLYWRLLLTRIFAALAVLLTVKNILFFIPCAKCFIERYGVWIFVLIIVGSLLYVFRILWYKPNKLSLD